MLLRLIGKASLRFFGHIQGMAWRLVSIGKRFRAGENVSMSLSNSEIASEVDFRVQARINSAKSC